VPPTPPPAAWNHHSTGNDTCKQLVMLHGDAECRCEEDDDDECGCAGVGLYAGDELTLPVQMCR